MLFMVVLGIFFFGRAYNIYGTITQAAQQGARAAVVTDLRDLQQYGSATAAPDRDQLCRAPHYRLRT